MQNNVKTVEKTTLGNLFPTNMNIEYDTDIDMSESIKIKKLI
jgi:hypothetical protein